MKPSPIESAVEIREAVPEDGPALIAAIERVDTETDFLGEPGERVPWADQAEQQLRTFRENESAVYFLALEAGAIVGFLGAFRGGFAGNRGVLFIAHIGIRAHRRGRGIGTRLFADVESWARVRGLHRLELRVDEENAQGLALYRRRGFVEEGRLVASFRGSDGMRNHLYMGKLLIDVPPTEAIFEPPLPEMRHSLDGVVIRPIAAGDGAALQVFERRLLAALQGIYLKSLDEVRADVAEIEAQLTAMMQRPRTRALAAFDREGQIIAYGGLWPETFRRIDHEAACNINVLWEWWGSGLGRRLMADLDAWARENGIGRLVAHVQANNRRGRRFAEAAGFHAEAVLWHYGIIDGRAVDRVRLVMMPGSP